MDKNETTTSSRNTALVLAGAGIFFLLINHWVDSVFFTMAALLLIALGVYNIRGSSRSRGFICLFFTGVLLLIGSDFFSFPIFLILTGVGLFYHRSKKIPKDSSFQQKHNFVNSVRWGKEPWVVKDIYYWHIIGEIRMDLTTAILEHKETTIIVQGIVGDLDIIVPDYLAVEVNASLAVGQMNVGPHREAGFINKTVWRSLNYEAGEQKVKLVIGYLVGDIDVKVM